MRIVLYKNSAQKNVVDKTAYLSVVDTIDGTLRNQTSIISPIILLDTDSNTYEETEIVDKDSLIVADSNDIEVMPMSYHVNDILGANYAYIEELNRYYYIEDVTLVNNRLMQVSMKVDSLMSFNEEIRDNTIIVERSESVSLLNNDLDDKAYNFPLTKQIKYVTLNEFIPSNKRLPETQTIFDPSSGSIMFSFITLEDYMHEPSNDSYTETARMIGANLSTQYLVSSNDKDTSLICQKITSDSTLESFIKHVTRFPYEISTEKYISDVRQICIGNDAVKGAVILSQYIEYPSSCLENLIIASFKVTPEYSESDTMYFTCLAPYTTFELFVPYYGFINLDANDIYYRLIQIRYIVNYDDGTAIAIVGAFQKYESTPFAQWTNFRILWTSKVDLGMKISLSSTNVTLKRTQDASMATNSILGIVSSILMTAAGAATGNVFMQAAGAAGIAGTVIKSGTAFASSNVRGNIVLNSDLSGIMNEQYPFLRVTSCFPSDGNILEMHKGKLCRSEQNLKYLTGFTMIDSNAHLSIPSATKTELDEIENLAKTGIIL